MNGSLLNPANYDQEYADAFSTVTVPQFDAYGQFEFIYFGSIGGDFWLNGLEPDGAVQTQAISRLIDGPDSDELLLGARSLPKDTPEQVAELESLIAPYISTSITRRNTAGETLTTFPDTDYIYDPRWRPWYQNAQSISGPVWSSVYRFSSSGQFSASGKVGVTVSAAVRNPDESLAGVVGIDIVLEEIDAFLEALDISENGRAFLFTNEGLGVAYGSLQLAQEGREPAVLDPVKDISDFAVRTGYNALLDEVGFECTIGEVDLDRRHLLAYQFGGSNYLAAFAPLGDEKLPDWNVGVVVPQDDFVGDFKAAYLVTTVASSVALLVVIVVALWISSLITTPIRTLTAEADRIRNLELDEEFSAPSPFVELQNMNEAFDRMKSGLRSFNKYIPSDVVSYLIRSGQDADLGGSDAELTIFFSDIAGFTTISESLTPDELVAHLGEYLGSFSRIISSTGGTVDKYIGDAVMAFWNAPTPVEDHVQAACRAAVECRGVLSRLRNRWKGEGKPALHARIGLHTGDVVVGNMGSDERLNYTILGDPVNLASRLEGLAKVYGVVILASETVYEAAKDQFFFRQLDRLTAKGKSVPVTVYELLAEHSKCKNDIRTWAGLYERGLEAYYAQNWDTAVQHFTKALTMRKGDRATRLMLSRIKAYRAAPPGADWDGVSRFTVK